MILWFLITCFSKRLITHKNVQKYYCQRYHCLQEGWQKQWQVLNMNNEFSLFHTLYYSNFSFSIELRGNIHIKYQAGSTQWVSVKYWRLCGESWIRVRKFKETLTRDKSMPGIRLRSLWVLTHEGDSSSSWEITGHFSPSRGIMYLLKIKESPCI